MEERIKKYIIEIAIEIAKEGKGALFVIGDKVDYELTFPQVVEKKNIFDNGMKKVLKSIGTLDGAVLINTKGDLICYGAVIKNIEKAFFGYGTRHAASIQASKNNNICVMCSEEERKVKLFKDGKYLMEVDALAKGIEKNIPVFSGFLESAGFGAVGAIGASTFIPALGIAILPGVIIFGSAYALIKYLKNL